MRFAIISDIHANKFAMQTVLDDIANYNVDQVICLGDLVGYGPDPQEVMQMTYENVHQYVLGNHDAVICGKLDPQIFNESARRMIAWTYERLDETAIEFFNSAPYIVHEDGFSFVHAEMVQPDWFGYIDSLEIAMESLDECDAPIVFAGHTHVLRVFCRDAQGNEFEMHPEDFTMEPGCRYVVTTGAVGFPRGNGLISTYTLFDNETKQVMFRNLPFDVDSYRQRCDELGMDTNSPSYRFMHMDTYTGTDVKAAEAAAHDQAVKNKVTLSKPVAQVEDGQVAHKLTPKGETPMITTEEDRVVFSLDKNTLLMVAGTVIMLLLMIIVLLAMG